MIVVISIVEVTHIILVATVITIIQTNGKDGDCNDHCDDSTNSGRIAIVNL